jgi:DNA-binding GntR family transcriptional regulator
MKRPPPAITGSPTKAVDTAEVHERIWSAIMDHSLPPETRLVEGELCEIFGLGRTRLRQVLQRLAHERVVTLMRNRGAKVSKPSVRDAREVFAARRVIEANIVEAFIKNAARKDVKRLQDHLAREDEAWRSGTRRAMLKLSGEFHLLLAQAAGNGILLELLRDLVSRSSLIIAAYQVPGAASCPPEAHRELTAALERR